MVWSLSYEVKHAHAPCHHVFGGGNVNWNRGVVKLSATVLGALSFCLPAKLAYGQTPQRHIETRFEDYDAYGNPGKVTWTTGDGYSSVTTTRYDNHPESWLIGLVRLVLETETTPSGESLTRTVSYIRDPNSGLVTQTTAEPDGDPSVKLVRAFGRDNTGLVTSIEYASADQQRVTQIRYETLENTWPVLVINPLFQIQQFAYHPSFGTMVAFRDENQNYARWQLDGFGRVRTQIPANGATTNISYMALPGTRPQGYTLSTITAGGPEVTSTVNSLGLESRESHLGFDGRRILVDKSYDAAARLSGITNPYFENELPAGSTLPVFDALGRLRTLTYPDGNFLERNYSGLRITSFDENRHQKEVREDQLHRTIVLREQADDEHSIETHFAYGPFGTLESVKDAAGNVTRLGFDVLGRLTVLVDGDSGRSVTRWNAFGEPIEEVNALGNRSRYARDLLGRAYSIRSIEGSTTIVWDQAANGIGKIASATSTDGVRSLFRYDSLSRVQSEEMRLDKRRFAFNYSYDSFGRLAGLQYPSPARAHDRPPFLLCFDYTPYGALLAVRDVSYNPGIALWENNGRNSFDQVTEEKFGDGTSTTREFDVRSRLWTLQTKSAGGPVQDLAYKYYPNGDLQSRTDGIEHIVESYVYDALDRLKKWDVNKNNNPDLGQEFKYDDIGNLRSRSTLFGSGQNLVYEYSGIKAGPHAVTSVNSSVYSYDPAGRESTAPGRHTDYLSWGLPKRIVGTSGTDYFKYDFQQRRILKLRSDGTHIVTVDGLFDRVSKGGGLGTNTYYVRAADRVVAAIVLDEVSKRRSVQYLHDDRLGSVVVVTKDGGLPESKTYDPFGTPREAADPSVPAVPFSSEPLGFTEREADSEASLVNMLGRLYDPNIGRFTTPDPIQSTAPRPSQAYNAYTYVLNNPVRWNDPTGLACDDVDCHVMLDQYGNPYWYSVTVTPSPTPLPGAGVSDDAGTSQALDGSYVNSSSQGLTPPPMVPLPGEENYSCCAAGSDPSEWATPPSARTSESSAGRPQNLGEFIDLVNGRWDQALERLHENGIPANRLAVGQGPWSHSWGELQKLNVTNTEAMTWGAYSGSTSALIFGLQAPLGASGTGAAAQVSQRIPSLTKGEGATMLRQAVEYLKRADASSRVVLFQNFVGQIESATNGAWSATTIRLSKGGAIFAGEGGEALVIGPGGRIFRGNLSNIGTEFQLGSPEEPLLPIYRNLREIK